MVILNKQSNHCSEAQIKSNDSYWARIKEAQIVKDNIHLPYICDPKS